MMCLRGRAQKFVTEGVCIHIRNIYKSNALHRKFWSFLVLAGAMESSSVSASVSASAGGAEQSSTVSASQSHMDNSAASVSASINPSQSSNSVDVVQTSVVSEGELDTVAFFFRKIASTIFDFSF